MAEDETENAADLAKEYVDLWEQQIGSLAKDPAVAQTMAQTLAMMHAGAAQMSAMMGSLAAVGRMDVPADTQASDAKNADSGNADAGGSAPDGVASHDPDADIRELARRVAELEERLRSLEQKS